MNQSIELQRVGPAGAVGSGRASLRRLVLLGLLAALAVLSARRAMAQDDVIRVRPQLTLDAARPLVLRDIAEVSGPEATKAADVVVSTDKVYDGLRLDVPAIRRALELEKSVNLGRIRLTGAACVVRVGAAAAATNGGGKDEPMPAAPAGAETVRDRIGAYLASLFEVGEDDLRLTYDEADGAVLGRATGTRIVSIQPQGNGDRLPLTVRLYEGDVLVMSGSVRVGVEVRRRVLVASRPLARGDVVSEEGATIDTQWMSASATPANPEQALGQVTRSPVRAGEVIGVRDVEAPVIVKKGDLVAVDCICGGVVVRATLRAMEPGREGDVIQLRPLTGKSNIRARVAGPGEAVINAPGGLPGVALGGGR